jgi:hypothetical protein
MKTFRASFHVVLDNAEYVGVFVMKYPVYENSGIIIKPRAKNLSLVAAMLFYIPKSCRNHVNAFLQYLLLNIHL